MKNKSLTAIILVVFIDLLGFSLILPLLPYYATTYGASSALTGLLVASYAMMQLIGAPLLGRLSDRFGRRSVLLISVGGTSLGFLLLGLAQPIGTFLAQIINPNATNAFILALLFLSRVLDGLTGGNLSVAQAYITDVTEQKERAKGLGLIGAAFGLGFIIGPAAGGMLSQWGYAVPAFVATTLSAFNLGLIYFWLPESLSASRRAELRAHPKAPITLQALVIALKRPYSGSLLTTRFFFNLAFSILQTIFSLYALKRFNLEARETGFILTYVGLLSVFVQGFLVGRLSTRYRDDLLIPIAVSVMSVAMLGWSWAPTLPWLLVVMAPMSISGGLLNTLLSSALTKAVHKDEVGGILGLGASIDSATRIIAPILGGVLIQQYGASAPGICGALILVALSLYVWRAIYAHPIAMEIGTNQQKAAA